MLKYGSCVTSGTAGGRWAWAALQKQTIAKHNAPRRRPSTPKADSSTSFMWLPFRRIHRYLGFAAVIRPVLPTSTLTMVNRSTAHHAGRVGIRFVNLPKGPSAATSHFRDRGG